MLATMPVHVTLEILARVVRIASGKNTASGIYTEHAGRRFIVTAAHMLHGANTGDQIAIRHQGSWAFRKIIGLHFAESADACIVIPETQWGDALPLDHFSAHGLLHGEQVAFCGFPLGLEMDNLPETGGWPIAFVKGGIFSGATSDGVMMFDALNNVGFSGGPVVRVTKNGELRIVGIVSGYMFDAPQYVKQKDEQGKWRDTSYAVLPNSGFMRVVSSKSIKDVIEEAFGVAVPRPRDDEQP